MIALHRLFCESLTRRVFMVWLEGLKSDTVRDEGKREKPHKAFL